MLFGSVPVLLAHGGGSIVFCTSRGAGLISLALGRIVVSVALGTSPYPKALSYGTKEETAL